MYQLIKNHNGRGVFIQNILQSNIFLYYITTLQPKNRKRFLEIQYSTESCRGVKNG